VGPHREGGPVPAAALVLARRVQEGEYESAHETRARSRLPNTRPLSFPQVLLWTTTVLSASGVAATEDALYLCRETVSGVGEGAERVERVERAGDTRARPASGRCPLSLCRESARAARIPLAPGPGRLPAGSSGSSSLCGRWGRPGRVSLAAGGVPDRGVREQRSLDKRFPLLCARFCVGPAPGAPVLRPLLFHAPMGRRGGGECDGVIGRR